MGLEKFSCPIALLYFEVSLVLDPSVKSIIVLDLFYISKGSQDLEASGLGILKNREARSIQILEEIFNCSRVPW